MIRGWVGLGCMVLGLVLMFIEQTKPASFVVIGFGLGMMSSGFK